MHQSIRGRPAGGEKCLLTSPFYRHLLLMRWASRPRLDMGNVMRFPLLRYGFHPFEVREAQGVTIPSHRWRRVWSIPTRASVAINLRSKTASDATRDARANHL